MFSMCVISGSPVGAVQASLSSVASGPLVYSITGTAAIAQAFAIQETHVRMVWHCLCNNN